MATTVLTYAGAAAGTAIGGPGAGTYIGAALGAALGSYIDQQFLLPLFVKTPKTHPPTFDSMFLQTASEGNPINYCLGPTVRTAGQIIWINDVDSHAIKKSGGGKKSDSVTIGYRYIADLAVAICEGEISDLKKIWADGKLIYTTDTDLDESSTDIQCIKENMYYYPNQDIEDDAPEVEYYHLKLKSTGTVDLTNFYPGEDVVISGSSERINNGTFKVLKVYTSGSDSYMILKHYVNRVTVTVSTATTVTYKIKYDDVTIAEYTAGGGDSTSDIATQLTSSWTANVTADCNDITATASGATVLLECTSREFADFITTGIDAGMNLDYLSAGSDTLIPPVSVVAGDTIRLQQTVPTLDESTCSDIELYKGTTTQTADDTIEAVEGVGSVPAFRGIAYIVLTDFDLSDYGNRIPTFNFLVEADATLTVRSAIGDICDRSGLSGSDYDVTGVDAGKNIRGLIFQGLQQTVSMLRYLLITYNLDVREEGGILYFYDKDNLTTVTVDADDLTSHIIGDNVEKPFTINNVPSVDLPQEVNITYFDKGLNYQQGGLNYSKNEGFFSANKTSINLDLPIVLNPDEAHVIAKRQLWEYYVTRKKINLYLPLSYLHIQISDILQFTYDSETYNIKVDEFSIGQNQLIEVSGSFYESSFQTQSSTIDDNSVYDDSLEFAPALYSHILDIAPLKEEHCSIAGVYLGATVIDDDIDFKKANIHTKFNSMDGQVIHWRDNLNEEAYGGQGITTAAGYSSGGSWDTNSEIYVELYKGGLESSSEEDVLNGKNRAVIGNEIIGWKTATLVSGSTYKLTNLLRGLRNTEDYINMHELNESFLLLDESNALIFKQLNYNWINRDIYWYMIQNGQSLEDVIPKKIKYQAGSVRPWAPCHIKGVRDSSNNLTISWIRRTRVPFSHFSGTQAPLIDTPEEYVVRIYSISTEEGTTISANSTGNKISAISNAFGAFNVDDFITIRGFDAERNNQRFQVVSVPTFAFPPYEMALKKGNVVTESAGNIVTVYKSTLLRTCHINILSNGSQDVSTYTADSSWYYPDSTSIIYPASGGGDQTGDGITPGDAIMVQICQKNSIIGEGRYKEELIL